MIYLMQAGLEPTDAFKIMESVRKGLVAKGKVHNWNSEYVPLMEEHGVPGWYINSCEIIKYMFPKAHAAAYVTMAFRIAWYKVYYPEAFYATYYTVRADDFDAALMCNGKENVVKNIEKISEGNIKLSTKDKNIVTILEVVNEMYARGIKFLPIDLYKSEATRFVIEEGGIRPPFTALQGVGESAAKSIVNARGESRFLSVEDLINKARVSKTVVDLLKDEGCLEGLSETSQISMF